MSSSYEVGTGAGLLCPVGTAAFVPGTSVRGAVGRARTRRMINQRVAVSMGVLLRTIAPELVRYR